jgi:hypothetical protein
MHVRGDNQSGEERKGRKKEKEKKKERAKSADKLINNFTLSALTYPQANLRKTVAFVCFAQRKRC